MPEEHHVTGAGPRCPCSAAPEEEDAVSWQPPRLSHPSASASAAAGPIASCSTPLPRGYSGGPGALMSANEASRSMRLPGCKSAPHHLPKWALWLLEAGGEQLRGWATARLLSLQEEQGNCCGTEGPACNADRDVPGAGRQGHGFGEVLAAASMSCRHPFSAGSGGSPPRPCLCPRTHPCRAASRLGALMAPCARVLPQILLHARFYPPGIQREGDEAKYLQNIHWGRQGSSSPIPPSPKGAFQSTSPCHPQGRGTLQEQHGVG